MFGKKDHDRLCGISHDILCPVHICANSPGLPRILLGNRMKFHGNHSLQNILPSSNQGTCSFSDMGLGWCLKSLGSLTFITQSLIIAPHPLTPKI